MFAPLRSFLHDRFLHLLLLLGILLAFWAPLPSAASLYHAVSWSTIATLAGLLILTRGIDDSGYFRVAGRRLVTRFHTQRTLALFLVAAAALLASVLTNDVALFITVPLTLSLRQYVSLPANRLIIFEALAVNVGSLLTPIGNPQNIMLWQQQGIGFWQFIGQMSALGVLLMLTLLILTWVCFASETLQVDEQTDSPEWHRPLLYCSVVMYLLFLVAVEMGQVYWGLLSVLLLFLLMGRKILLTLDWSLLAVFIMMFVDVDLLTRLPQLRDMLAQVSHLSALQQFLLSIGLSQVISNVPATILLSGTMGSSLLLAWGVNIGGFGLLPGSLANLIALRMAKNSAIWWQFHLFSVPMLVWSVLFGGLLLSWLGHL
ncbi:MAG: Inner membrane protein YbiR [Candidatus Erwinia impunctatus]|nr:Inner membrane protein YbiR [Culicoides impunctatus]